MTQSQWVTNWESPLTAGEGTVLTKEDNTDYAEFSGISLPKGKELNGKTGYIGIYQAGEKESVAVYAFASTATEASSANVSIKGAEEEGNGKAATLLAKGETSSTSQEGDEGEKQLTDIEITLIGNEAGENDTQFTKLGFSGENISKITGSDKADKIYIISSQEKNGVSKNAVLNFAQKGNDSVVFSGSTTIQSITSGGGVYSP